MCDVVLRCVLLVGTLSLVQTALAADDKDVPAPPPRAEPTWGPPQAPPTPVMEEEIAFEEESPLLQSLDLGPAGEKPTAGEEVEIPLDIEEAAPSTPR